MRALLLLAASVALALPASAQDPGATATYAEISLAAGFTPDPYSLEITAGGSTSVDVTSACDYGVVADAPDLEINLTDTDGGALYIYALSAEDTTLLVNLPDGSWLCDDDSYDDGDPLLEIDGAAAGLYDVWVGTYGGQTAEATLFVSEFDPR